MKCVFAAKPYHFTVQYHADALVAAHDPLPWVMSIDGVEVSYRRHACSGAAGPQSPPCAVFVPSAMGERAAGRLLAAFAAAHPGVIPPDLVVPLERGHWWSRARLSLPSPSNWLHYWNDS